MNEPFNTCCFVADDFTGYFTNAALSNAKSIEDAQLKGIAIFQQLKVTPEQVVQGISALAQRGVIDKQTAVAYVEGLAIRQGECYSLLGDPKNASHSHGFIASWPIFILS